MYWVRHKRSTVMSIYAKEQELVEVSHLEAGCVASVWILHHGDDRHEHHYTDDEGNVFAFITIYLQFIHVSTAGKSQLVHVFRGLLNQKNRGTRAPVFCQKHLRLHSACIARVVKNLCALKPCLLMTQKLLAAQVLCRFFNRWMGQFEVIVLLRGHPVDLVIYRGLATAF